MSILTQEQCAEIRARWAALLPPPWTWRLDAIAHNVQLLSQQRNIIFDCVRWGMDGAQLRFNCDGFMHKATTMAVPFCGHEHHAAWRSDINNPLAQAMVSAPTDIPALLDTIEALRAAHRKTCEVMSEYLQQIEATLQFGKHTVGPVHDGLIELARARAELELETEFVQHAGDGRSGGIVQAAFDWQESEIARLTAENETLRTELEGCGRYERDLNEASPDVCVAGPRHLYDPKKLIVDRVALFGWPNGLIIIGTQNIDGSITSTSGWNAPAFPRWYAYFHPLGAATENDI